MAYRLPGSQARSPATPYGVEDLSGNVWEWTRSKEGKYPYPQQQTARARRESLQLRREDWRRVLRGGSVWGDHQEVRCASRLWSNARGRYSNIGLRVVVAALP